MNRDDIVDQVHRLLNKESNQKHKDYLSKKQVELIVKTTFEAIIYNLAAFGEDVHIPRFGTFVTKINVGRQGRNPATGEPLYLPARTVVKFKASKPLKGMINR